MWISSTRMAENSAKYCQQFPNRIERSQIENFPCQKRTRRNKRKHNKTD